MCVEIELPDDTLLIITSDHGGVGTENGNLDNTSIIVPFLVYGPSIKKGYRIRKWQ